MTDEKLRRSLDELREELARLESEEAAVRERIDALISGVESRLESPDEAGEDHTLVEDLQRAVTEFETSHPRATAILNQIMVTLGNMGI